MHKKFQMSSMGELTFFPRLQVKQKEDGIFISQDKYVIEILKKFSLSNVKTASTPMETNKPLLEDADGKDVDEHLYRSMIGSLMYLTSLRPDIMFAICQPKLGLWYPKDSPFNLVAYTDSDYAGASLDRKSTTGGCQFLGCRLILWQWKKQTVVTNSITEVEYIAASNCCGQATAGSVNAIRLNLVLLVQVNAVEGDFINTSIEGFIQSLNRFQSLMIFLDKQVEGMSKHKEIYVTPSHTKKVFANMKRQGKDFSGRDTPLFPTMIVQAQEQVGEGSDIPTDSHHTPTTTQPSTSKPQKKQSRRKQRKDTEDPQLSGPTEPVTDDTKNVASVPTHSNDPLLSGLRSWKRKEGDELTGLEDYTRLVDLQEWFPLKMKFYDTKGRYGDNLMFDTGVLDNEQDMAEKSLDYELAARLQAEEQGELTIEEKVSERQRDKNRRKVLKAEKNLNLKILNKAKLDEKGRTKVDDDQEEVEIKKHMEIDPMMTDSAANVLADWNAVYDAHNEVACLMLGWVGLIKDFAGFMRNYNMHNTRKTIGELHAMLIEYEKGKGKANGKGKDKQVYIPKPKNPKPTAKEHTQLRMTPATTAKEVGHWKWNCPVYLAELLKKKKQAGAACSSVSKNNVLYFNVIPSNGIYEIDMHDLVPNVNSIYNVSTKRAKHNLDSTYLWHCRLAHINVSRQCASYFITFTDDYSLYGYVYLLKHKHEVFETFKVFKNEVENQLRKTIKALRSDRGGEYISQEF
ncbi:putative ribonuclease H-like domain-containing protein [Tanacetum coccineum]